MQNWEWVVDENSFAKYIFEKKKWMKNKEQSKKEKGNKSLHMEGLFGV